MPTTQTPICGIGLLPVELLQRIFELHTLVNLGSPHMLRRVCRHWLLIVDGTTMLRTRIYFGGRIFRRKEMVICYSLGHLLQAIQQTQKFQHELTIAAEGEPMAALTQPGEHDAKWVEFVSSGTSRCRSLAIHYTDMSPRFQSTLGNCDFPELCELNIGFNNYGIEKTHFFDAIQRSSIRLCDLTVNRDMVPNLLKYPLLLRRLTRLSLKGCNQNPTILLGLWEQLVHLVDLTISNELLLCDHKEVTLPSLSRMKIGISPRCELRPLAIYLQITNLTFALNPSRLSTSPQLGKRVSVQMPRLQYLEIHSIWLPICIIDAPNLSVLALRGGEKKGRAAFGTGRSNSL